MCSTEASVARYQSVESIGFNRSNDMRHLQGPEPMVLREKGNCVFEGSEPTESGRLVWRAVAI